MHAVLIHINGACWQINVYIYIYILKKVQTDRTIPSNKPDIMKRERVC